ncbi:MAG: shikimate kinase [Pelagibacterales bacterium]|nr:shikimate kinase [Pelagibacterales bacterium]
MKKNLVLLGMMAVGKTTLGKIVAKKQELKFIDIDASIEKKNSMTIKEIFKKKGEKFFRMEEENEILKSLEKNNCVIALGGGAFMNKTVRENILKNAISIWLSVDIKTLNQRIKWNRKRPLLKEENYQKKITELYAERKDIYKLANHQIACDKLSKKNIAEKIIALYEKY